MNRFSFMSENIFIPYQISSPNHGNILVIAPHPDDETIGCGGSIALHINRGDCVKITYLTDGSKGDQRGRYNKEELVKIRYEEATKACRILGVRDIIFYSYPDRELYQYDESTDRILDVLISFNPALIYAPSPLEFHPDHRSAAWLLLEAIHRTSKHMDIAFYEINQPLRVNMLVDISSTVDLKKKALCCYKSQLSERNYDEICLALNRFRSMTIEGSCKYAEGFVYTTSDSLKKVPSWAFEFYISRVWVAYFNENMLLSILKAMKWMRWIFPTNIYQFISKAFIRLRPHFLL